MERITQAQQDANLSMEELNVEVPPAKEQDAPATATGSQQELQTGGSPIFDFSGVNSVKNDPDKPGPYLLYEVNLETGEVSINKMWEFRSGPMVINVFIKRPGEKSSQSSKFFTNDGGSLGDLVPTATEAIVLKNALTSRVLPDMLRQQTLESQNLSDGLKIGQQKCAYTFEKVPPEKMYNSREYFREVGLPFYLKMRKAEDISINNNTIQKKVWDVKGAVFALCLSAIETGYANKSSFDTAKKKGNYWGVGGASSFQTVGNSFDSAYNYWIDFMSYGYLKSTGKRDGKGWPDAIRLFESGDFTADQMNMALHSGRHKPASDEKNKGMYPYNADPRGSNENYYKDSGKKEFAEYTNYAGKIMDESRMKMVILRFATFLDEEIANASSGWNLDPVSEKEHVDYKKGLYEAIKCELADFLQNDYPSMVSSKDSYDAK